MIDAMKGTKRHMAASEEVLSAHCQMSLDQFFYLTESRLFEKRVDRDRRGFLIRFKVMLLLDLLVHTSTNVIP